MAAWECGRWLERKGMEVWAGCYWLFGTLRIESCDGVSDVLSESHERKFSTPCSGRIGRLNGICIGEGNRVGREPDDQADVAVIAQSGDHP